MKKIFLFLTIFTLTICHSQISQNPIVILNTKNLGYINDLKKEMDSINPNDISSVNVIKDSIISKKYGSKNGLIIITTKKYIIETFFNENIKNSTLQKNIKSAEELVRIGVITKNTNSKNQPYDELSRYVADESNKKEIKKVEKIIFIKSKDAVKINPIWINGAIEINPEKE